MYRRFIHEYETKRLILKIVRPSDANLILKYYMSNKEFLKPWEPLRNDRFYTYDYHYMTTEIEYKMIRNKECLRFWIIKKEDRSKLIGTFAFSNIVRGVFQSCYLGYKLDKNEINNGYMTEAISKGIDIIFNDWKLHRIEANIMPRNNASKKVVEKLGFSYEGLSKKYLKINGKWEDHIHMVLLNKDC